MHHFETLGSPKGAKKLELLSPFALLRLLFVLAMEHTLLCMFLNIWHQFLFLGDLHDAAL